MPQSGTAAGRLEAARRRSTSGGSGNKLVFLTRIIHQAPMHRGHVQGKVKIMRKMSRKRSGLLRKLFSSLTQYMNKFRSYFRLSNLGYIVNVIKFYNINNLSAEITYTRE